MTAIVRIIPPVERDGGITRAQGTKVMVGDMEIPRVFKVELSAETGGLWTAKIHCFVQALPMEDIHASIVKRYKAPILWRLKQWYRGWTGMHWNGR